MTNNTCLIVKNQPLVSTGNVTTISGLSIRELIQYFNSMPERSIKLLDRLFWLCQRYPSVYIAQEKLANWVGYCRKTANLYLKMFHEMGIICKKWRGVKKTCIYSVHPYFRNSGILEKLSFLFNSFRKISRSLLATPHTPSRSTRNENVTQLYYMDIVYNNFSENNLADDMLMSGSADTPAEKITKLLGSDPCRCAKKTKERFEHTCGLGIPDRQVLYAIP